MNIIDIHGAQAPVTVTISNGQNTTTATSQKQLTKTQKPKARKLATCPPDGETWILSSGTCVETQLLKHKGLLPQNLILDLSDPTVTKLFTKSELSEIRTSAKDLPPPRTLPSLSDVNTMTALRSLAVDLLRGEPNDVAGWAAFVLLFLTGFYQRSYAHVRHLEKTYENFWSNVLDSALLQGGEMYVMRGECQSSAMQARLNENRDLEDDVQAGERYDGIFKHYDTTFEAGFLEASRDDLASHARKLLADCRKTILAMRASIVHFNREHDDPDLLRNVECVSVVTSGVSARLIHMGWGGGHVCLVQRTEPVVVPKDVKNLPKISDTFVMVWRVVDILLRCRKAIDAAPSTRTTHAESSGWISDERKVNLRW